MPYTQIHLVNTDYQTTKTVTDTLGNCHCRRKTSLYYQYM